MCTLTVLRERDRVLVTMNRDDSAVRPEEAPAAWPNSNPRFVAPKDLKAGGTWIGANAHGVVACLLNRYDPAPAGHMSRGSIVVEAMQSASIGAARESLSALDLGAYSPFTCVIIARDGGARLDWTGAELKHTGLSVADEAIMLTSSSWRFDEVKAQREAFFERVWSDRRNASERIATFHSRRDSAHDAWAPMMQRPQSQTKSVTQVELTSRGAEMRYWTRDAAIESQLSAPSLTIPVPG